MKNISLKIALTILVALVTFMLLRCSTSPAQDTPDCESLCPTEIELYILTGTDVTRYIVPATPGEWSVCPLNLPAGTTISVIVH